ncbi:MAG: N-acetyltransferase [Thalassobaculaceae bacterium]|nr:N-acetyltransferase [Thalassobaculaceae bacterium]
MTVTDVEIREARPEDIPEIADLHTRSWRANYGTEFSSEELGGTIQDGLHEQWRRYRPAPSDLVLVARGSGGEGSLLGFGAIWCRPDPYLDNLHVAPDALGAGVGRALLREARIRLQSRGLVSLSLSVFKSNEAARRFYARVGGTEVKEYRRTVFGAEILFIRVAWPDLTRLTA